MWKKIIILVVIGILFISACYAFYRERSLDENNKEINLATEEKNNIQEELMDIINSSVGEAYLITTGGKDVLNVEKYLKDLDNQTILQHLFMAADFDYGDSFKASILDETAEELFENSVTYKHTDINCFCGERIYKYNSKTNKYTYDENHGGHGGISSETASYLQQFDYKNEKYIVRVKSIFYLGDEMGFAGGYKSIYDLEKDNLLIKRNNKCLSNDDIIYEYSDVCYEKYKDKLNTYEYTFSKDRNNKYHLISYKLIEE